ncbi:MAG: acetyl-CoA carboxylase, carboxyltransferase subunit beta [Lachnospiraceae bacterium]|nr:acetyl-CoA carboxylase, carboxyltransferase subunit beta [Lachnospiraceae bacterium]
MVSLTNTISFPIDFRKDIDEEIVKKDKEPVFVTCKTCKRRSLKKDWKDNYYVCPNCGKYSTISAYYRLSLILDPRSFKELNANMKASDPMEFPEYKEKLQKQKKETGLEEAAVTATGKIGGHKVTVIVLDSRFFMGSMSTIVGEKVTRAVEYATKKKTPLIIFSASGGARMQEGIYSLMQMAKTAAAVEEFNASGGLYISYLTHPTTGGVTASFASLGDITLAEPGALIGFAGPRVIEQTIHKKLPKGFQRSEYLESHGFVDKIVPRSEMRETLLKLIELHQA